MTELPAQQKINPSKQRQTTPRTVVTHAASMSECRQHIRSKRNWIQQIQKCSDKKYVRFGIQAYKVKLSTNELRNRQPAVEAKGLPAISFRGGPRRTTHIHSSILFHVVATCRSGPGRATHVGSSILSRAKIRGRSEIWSLPTPPMLGWAMRGRNINNSQGRGDS